jgi:3-methylfumaryl-CoA hydratase
MGAFDEWIGRQTSRTEPITARMLREYHATLAGTRGPGAVLPGFHWCLAPDVVEPQDFGRDGHPRTGIFLPALPLPLRMWAGGALEFHAPFQPGDIVTRQSTIAEVTFKTGRSGQLGFVTVAHEYSVAGAPRLSERQDIVYRAPAPAGQPAPAPAPAEEWDALRRWSITPTPTLLFRYSALTFNGHRIHYDHPYATGVEGYDGLVVHGPLQSVWMQNLAATVLGHLPARFSYRGLVPLICNLPVTIEARQAGGGLDLRVRRDDDGVVTMQARAEDPNLA